MNDDEVKLDKNKAVKMINRIYRLELDNAKTKKYSDKKMRDAIERIIETIVKGEA